MGYDEDVNLHELRAHVAELTDELDSIKNSRSYRTLIWFKKSLFGVAAWKLAHRLLPLIKWLKRGQLTNETHDLVSKPVDRTTKRGPVANHNEAGFETSDMAWLTSEQAHLAVAVYNPEWLGITSSTKELFDNIVPIPDDLDPSRARKYARLFKQSGVPAVVLQGFPINYRFLVRALHEEAPDLPVYSIWHGNFYQVEEDYAWHAFRLVTEYERLGLIRSIGFVKQGMAEVLARQGVRTGFVMNYVRQIPVAPAMPQEDGLQIGLWSSWHKLPYVMLAAASSIRDAKVHVVWGPERAQEFAQFLKMNVQKHGFIPQAQTRAFMACMHLNLYVTLNECAPMLPLESLSMGVPCLFGPNSHYFEDHEYLHSRLVVPHPDSSASIQRLMERAIDERQEIISQYRAYAPDYNVRARASLSQFLELPAQQIWSGV